MKLTIGELIALLSKYPPETRVMVSGYENGIEDPGSVELVDAWKVPYNSWWEGTHQTRNGTKSDQPADLKVVLISR